MRPAEGLHPSVTEPVDVYDEQQDADRPHELHNLGKAPQIVFVLHGGNGLKDEYRGLNPERHGLSPTGTLWHSPAATIGILSKYPVPLHGGVQ